MFLSRPRTGSKRLALLAAPLFTLVALSGCLGGDDGDIDTDVISSDCAEAPGVLEIHVLPGSGLPDSTAWYDPATPDLTGIHTICWVNDDDVYHRIIAEPLKIDTTPEWVTKAVASAQPEGPAGGHHNNDGDGHAHDAAALVFDVEFDGGERLAMPLPTGFAALAVHCHPHPWMVSEWSFLPEKAESYATEIGHIVYENQSADDTKATESKALAFDLTSPDLHVVRATLSWDDGADDQLETGTTLNKADKMQLEIKDPSGTSVGKKDATLRNGTLVIEHIMPIVWPTEVTARGPAAAAEKLAADVPPDVSRSGEWTVIVTVLMGNGPTNLDGNTAATPDGHQAWALTFEAEHEYARVLPAGRTHMVLNNPAATVGIDATSG